MGCQVLTLAELPFSSLPSHRLGLLNLVQRTKPDLRPREREGRLDHRRRATRPAVGDNAPDVPSTSFPRRLSAVAGVAPSQRCLRQNPCPRGTPFPGSDPRAPLPPVLNADGQLLNSEVAGRFALAMQSQYTPWEASRLPMLRRTQRGRWNLPIREPATHACVGWPVSFDGLGCHQALRDDGTSIPTAVGDPGAAWFA